MEGAGAIKYLVVNPENLKTHILNNIEAQPVTWNNVLNLLKKHLIFMTGNLKSIETMSFKMQESPKQIVRSKVLV
jgi:hypothetical protein